MLLFQGRISPRPPKNMTLCVIGRARFERNCGNIYSRHLFLLGGLGFWDRYWRDAGQLWFIFSLPLSTRSLCKVSTVQCPSRFYRDDSRGEDSYFKRAWMLVVSLRCVNF